MLAVEQKNFWRISYQNSLERRRIHSKGDLGSHESPSCTFNSRNFLFKLKLNSREIDIRERLWDLHNAFRNRDVTKTWSDYTQCFVRFFARFVLLTNVNKCEQNMTLINVFWAALLSVHGSLFSVCLFVYTTNFWLRKDIHSINAWSLKTGP